MFIAPFASFSITPYILSQRLSQENTNRIAKKSHRCTDISETLRNFAVQKC